MKGKICILINGHAGSEKDTFADFMIEKFKEYKVDAFVHSSVDNVREAARYLGWEGVKDTKGRNFLSALKDMSTKWWDAPFLDICDIIENLEEDEAVILMVREPVEIDRLVERFPEIITVLIQRDEHIVAT